jgi:hypothetical protein
VLVRANSRFWNASGVNVKLGVGGLDVRTDSLESILEGGIEFATPNSPGPQAKTGKLFALNDEPEATWLAWAPKIWLDPDGEKRAVAHALPAAEAKPRGLEIVLESFEVASVKAGDAIYYREVKVGEIGEHELSLDARTVRIHAHIEPRYATLVRSNSRFWNASGISAHFGLGGLDVQTESLESIMAGGVAFATPDEPGAAVKPGTIFPLHPEANEDWKRWSTGAPRASWWSTPSTRRPTGTCSGARCRRRRWLRTPSAPAASSLPWHRLRIRPGPGAQASSGDCSEAESKPRNERESARVRRSARRVLPSARRARSA